jgi:hypothetical protein
MLDSAASNTVLHGGGKNSDKDYKFSNMVLLLI